MKFFSYESKFSQLLLKLCYSCYLNLLWLICSLPIVTIGASTTALYYATLKIADDEHSYVARMFFRSFKENFRQATVIWLIMLGAGILLGVDGYIIYHLRAASTGTVAVMWTLLLALLIAAAIVFVIVLLYVFPLVARVTNTTGAMLKNAFFMGIRYLFCTILVFAIHLAMFVVVVRVYTPVIIFGEGLCALLSSYLLSNVIRACSYDPNKADDDMQGDAGEGKL